MAYSRTSLGEMRRSDAELRPKRGIALFGSVDAAWDASDTALGATLLLPHVAGKTTKFTGYWPTTTKLEHKFACGVVNLAGLGKEPTPADNSLCVPLGVCRNTPTRS